MSKLREVIQNPEALQNQKENENNGSEIRQ